MEQRVEQNIDQEIKQDARIPMLPEELPQQRRNHLARILPPKPEELDCICAFGEEMPDGDSPPQMPRTAHYVGMVEWAWDPMHSRLDAYYISTNRKRTHWILWVRGLDEWGAGLAHIEYAQVYAYCRKRGVSEETAAVYLLMSAWNYEVNDYGLEKYHWISEEGLLSVSHIEAIARQVWIKNAQG